MQLYRGKATLTMAAAGFAFFALSIVPAMARSHYELNGVWRLVPAQNSYEGQPVTETGTVSIHERQHNIYVSRNFTYDGAKNSYNSHFMTDGRNGAKIRQGKNFVSKADWDGDTLVVKTTADGATNVERYSLMPDGRMQLMVERPDHTMVTLYFERAE